MEKIKLSICEKHKDGNWGTLGMPYLLECIMKSDLYEIDYHDYVVSTTKGERATVLFCNEKKVYLDFWEYPAPCYTRNVYDENFDLIIKLQHRGFDQVSKKGYYDYFSRKRMFIQDEEEVYKFLEKVSPWTFFASKMFNKYLGKEVEAQDSVDKIESFGFFCGKYWKCRKPVLRALSEYGLEVLDSNQHRRRGRKLRDEDYLDKMKSSKFGIVLGGRSTRVTDKKNRREIDYMILKKPLLLDYKPHYYDPLIDGEHYIYIDKNTDFSKIEENHDVEKIAENAYNWYNRNASASGVAESLAKIFQEKLNH